MLDLKRSDRNRLVIFEESVGERKGVYYTTPTASQVVRYNRETIRRKNGKMAFDPGEAYMVSVRFGMEVCTGFDELNLDDAYNPIPGDFAYGFDGKPISSDPGSPNYREDWKELLKETAHGTFALISRVAFGGTRTEKGEDDLTFDTEAEEVPPLAKN